MPKPALVAAVDFSKGSQKAFQAALRLALDMKATLVLAHGLEDVATLDPLVGGRVGAPRRKGPSATGDAAEATRWMEQARRAGVECESVMRQGPPVKVILDAARKFSAGLIVAGSEGKTGLRKLFLGSVSQALIQRSPVPVLLTPLRMVATKRGPKPGPVLAAMDFSQDAEAAYEAAVRLSKEIRAPLKLVHVVEIWPMSSLPGAAAAFSPQALEQDEEVAAERLAQLSSQAKSKYVQTPSVRIGNPASEVLAAARECNASVIVVGTHGRGGLRKLMLGSVAEVIVQVADRPVLVVPNTARKASS